MVERKHSKGLEGQMVLGQMLRQGKVDVSCQTLYTVSIGKPHDRGKLQVPEHTTLIVVVL